MKLPPKPEKLSREKLLEKLQEYGIFVIYDDFFVPKLLKTFDKNELPGRRGFAYKIWGESKIEEFAWRENPDGTFSCSKRILSNFFLHPHFFPLEKGSPRELYKELREVGEYESN